MSLRRPAVLLLAAVLAALARSARADDAATAAAAMQAIGQAVPGGAAAGATEAQKKDSNGFDRELSAPKIERKTDGAKKSAARKAKRAKPAASKYKSTTLAGSVVHSYRFDENAEPLDVPKKKAAAKKAKKASSEAGAEDSSDERTACFNDEPCSVKSPDADAL